MRQAILLLTLMLAVTAVKAQNRIIFEENTIDSYLMKYGSKQPHLNNIIALLDQAPVSAQGGGRPSRKPEFTVRFDQRARITDVGDNLFLEINLTKVTVNGDMNFRGFDLGEVLKPEELKFKVWLLNSKNEKIKEYEDQRIALYGNSLKMFEVSIPDTATTQNYKLKIEGKELTYTSESENRLKERFNLIKEYFAAEAKIARVMQDVKLIRPDDVDRIDLQDRNLKENEDFYNYLKLQLSTKLHLDKSDPQGLINKLVQLNELLIERRRGINHTLSTLDQHFFNRGLIMMNNGNRSAAQVYFSKSVNVNPRFAPAHVELARIDFMNGYIREASNRTRDILTTMRLDRETEAIALDLMHDIYRAVITNGNTQTMRGEYNLALGNYAEARSLCHTIRGLNCNMNALNDGESRAALGAYRVLIDNGKRLLARNDVKEAERVAVEALNFQRDYDFVLGKEREAEELMGQVKFQFYLQYIEQGKQYLRQKNYNAALNEFKEALELEGRYLFKPVQELQSFAQKAAKPIILDKLSEGYELVMQNNLGSARATASAATAMQNRYGLQSDSDVMSKYDLLKERIFTQECYNIQAAYDKHYQNARNLIQQKRYIAADQAFAAALRVADEKIECSLASFTAKDGKAEIHAPATYQRMLENVNRSISAKRYSDAVQHYEEANAYYHSNNIRRFELSHNPLFNFAQGNKSKGFTAYVAAYFTSQHEEETAIQLLKSLLDRGYPKRKTKKTQKQIGSQLAAEDAKLDIQKDIKDVAEQHIKNHKGLKKLRKSYIKERKRLAKLR